MNAEYVLRLATAMGVKVYAENGRLFAKGPSWAVHGRLLQYLSKAKIQLLLLLSYSPSIPSVAAVSPVDGGKNGTLCSTGGEIGYTKKGTWIDGDGDEWAGTPTGGWQLVARGGRPWPVPPVIPTPSAKIVARKVAYERIGAR